MKIIELKKRIDNTDNDKLNDTYIQFGALITELSERDLPLNTVEFVNLYVAEINTTADKGNQLRKLVKKKQTKIVQHLEKELKIVPLNHYRNLWLAVGMVVFGLPIGIAFGSSVGNTALFAVGLPIGMFVGIALGKKLDKKAFDENRQLKIEIKP